MQAVRCCCCCNGFDCIDDGSSRVPAAERPNDNGGGTAGDRSNDASEDEVVGRAAGEPGIEALPLAVPAEPPLALLPIPEEPGAAAPSALIEAEDEEWGRVRGEWNPRAEE